MIKFLTSLLCSLAIFTSFANNASAPEEIYSVTGRVTNINDNTPISDISVVHEGTVLTYTNKDGQFTVRVPKTARIKLYHPSFNEQVIKLDGEHDIDIHMASKVVTMNQIMVVFDGKPEKIATRDGEVTAHGEYYHLKTRFHIPEELSSSDKQLIIQPTLYDIDERKVVHHFKPVVIRGKTYNHNLNRYNSFEGKDKDPLLKYTTDQDLKETMNFYLYSDSVYIPSNKRDRIYQANCVLSIKEVTTRARYDFLDTIVVAKGVKNNLRFLEHKLKPVEMLHIANKVDPERLMLADKGSEQISFLINSDIIDVKDKTNTEKLNNITSKVSSILANKDATLTDITVDGYSSPDGPYEPNIKLAKNRAETIIEHIDGVLPSDIKSNIKFSTDSHVASWDQVALIAAKDKASFAGEMVEIIKTHIDDMAKIHKDMLRIKEYQNVIAPKYLPQLRRVDYEMKYDVLRFPNDNDIKDRFARQEKDLSQYEYWRLIELYKNNPVVLDHIERKALKSYPEYTYMANRIAVRQINANEPDLVTLDKYMASDAPVAVRTNQAVAAVMLGDATKADSIARHLPLSEVTERIKAITAALNGRYNEAYDIIVADGGLNKVLINLCLDQDDLAMTGIKELLEKPENGNNAKYWYIRAVCANRTDDLNWAIMSLKTAITLDPSLGDVARQDKELMDVYAIVNEEGDNSLDGELAKNGHHHGAKKKNKKRA